MTLSLFLLALYFQGLYSIHRVETPPKLWHGGFYLWFRYRQPIEKYHLHWFAETIESFKTGAIDTVTKLSNRFKNWKSD